MIQDSIRRQSELNFIERSKTMPVTIRADVARAHNYSAQSLNSTEIAKEKLRQELIKVMIFPLITQLLISGDSSTPNQVVFYSHILRHE